MCLDARQWKIEQPSKVYTWEIIRNNLTKQMLHLTNINIWITFDQHLASSRSEMFLGKGVLKICSKFTGEHLYQSVISIRLLCNFIEIALWHGCSPVNLLFIFRTSFPKSTSGQLLLILLKISFPKKNLEKLLMENISNF